MTKTMKMQATHLILLVSIIVDVKSSATKYIDLLPDKEKEEFLEIIVRRILGEVQIKENRPEASVELSDVQLDQHDDFVKQILKEESENLRKQANDTGSQKIEEEMENNPESITGPDRKEDKNNEDRYVDLTLRVDSNRNKRENKRRVFTGYAVDQVNSFENKNSEQSDVQDIQVKNFRKRRNDHPEERNIDDTTETVSPTEDNTEKYKKATKLREGEIALQTEDSTKLNEEIGTQSEGILKVRESTTERGLNKDESLTERDMYTAHQTETPLDNLNKYNKNEHSKLNRNDGDIIENSDIETRATITRATVNHSIGKELKETNKEVSKTQNKVNVKTNDDEPKASQNSSSRSNRTYIENSELNNNFSKKAKAITEMKTANSAGKMDSNVYNIEIKSATVTRKVIDTDMSPTTTDYDKHTNKTNIDAIDKNDGNDEMTRMEVLTTTSIPIKFKIRSNLNLDTNNDKIEIKAAKQSKTEKDKNASTSSENLTKNAVKALRANYFKANFKKKDKFSDLLESNERNRKKYEVYEISPDRPPFMKQKLPRILIKTTENSKTEERHYVPIYNYLPKNAFYNTGKVFGLDIDSDDEDSSKDLHIIKTNTNARTQTEKLSTNEQPYYVPVYNYSPKNAFYNPYNYFGRNTDEIYEKNENSDEFETLSNNKADLDYEYVNNFNDKGTEDYKTNGIVDEEFDDSNDDSDENFGLRNVFNDPLLRLGFDDVKKLKVNNEEFDKETDENENSIPRAVIEMSRDNKCDKLKEKQRDENIAVDYYFGRTKNEDDYFIKKLKEFSLVEHSDDSNKDFHIKLINFQSKSNDDVEPATLENVEKESNKQSVKNFNYLTNTIQNKQTDESTEDIPNTVSYEDLKKILSELDKKDLKKGQFKDLDIFVDVLKNMIQQNNEALTQYDWLGTTVDIQSANAKMIDMVEAVKNDEALHPSDLELLKYLVYLHSLAKEDLETAELRSLLLPHAKKKRVIKEPGLLNRVWLMRMDDQIPDEELREFGEFLYDMQAAFYDLHTAMKYIAIVTAYDSQKWFENLKQIYLDSSRKKVLEVILHMSTTRLLGLIEEIAKDGLEDDFAAYVIQHKKEVERAKEEFQFVLKILEELKYF